MNMAEMDIADSPGITALAKQFGESKLGSELPPAFGQRSPLGALNQQLGNGGNQNQNNVQPLNNGLNNQKAATSVPKANSNFVNPLLLEHTPLELALPPCPKSATPQTASDRPVRGRLVFECTGERKLEAVGIIKATTVRKQPAKRKLEDSFFGGSGGGSIGGNKGRKTRQPLKRAHHRPSSAPASADLNHRTQSLATSSEPGNSLPSPDKPDHGMNCDVDTTTNNTDENYIGLGEEVAIHSSRNMVPGAVAVTSVNNQHNIVAGIPMMPSTSGVFTRTKSILGQAGYESNVHHPRNVDIQGVVMIDNELAQHTFTAGGATFQQPNEQEFSPLVSSKAILPTVENPDCCCPSISPQTLKCLISSRGCPDMVNYVLIDCRYVFEHNGGHIKGALNFSTPEELDAYLQLANFDWNNTAIIFYCEFSSERAPRAFRHVRQEDRKRSFEKYDLVSLEYPHMFILQGGYSTFVAEAPELCDPYGAYISMHNEQHRDELQACHKHAVEAWAALAPTAKHNPLARTHYRKSYRVSDARMNS